MLDRDLEPPCEDAYIEVECPHCCINMEWCDSKFYFKCMQCEEFFYPPRKERDDEYDEDWRYVYDY